MSCALERGRLWLYLQGKLTATEAGAVEAHIEGCSSCQSLAVVSPELVRVLRGKLATQGAPPALRARLQAALEASTPAGAVRLASAPAWQRWLGSPWTPRLVVVILLAVLLLVPARSLFRAPAMAQEAVLRHDAHIPYCGGELPPCCRDLALQPGGVLSAPSAGETVPDLDAAGLALVVASRCDGGTPVNLLCYRSRAGELFSLYITDRGAEEFQQLRRGRRYRVQDHAVVAWERHGFAYFWVGPHGRDDTEQALALLLHPE